MGHYDSCRPGYCPRCGAGPGNISDGICDICDPVIFIRFLGGKVRTSVFYAYIHKIQVEDDEKRLKALG